MRKVILLIALTILSNSAMAEWTKVDEQGEITDYVDLSTISNDGDKAKMWELKDYKTANQDASGKWLSYKVQKEFDCNNAEAKKRTLTATFFSENMGKGRVVYSDLVPQHIWNYVLGAKDRDIFEMACKKLKTE